MTKIIEITVAPNGSSTVETKGFTGPDCQNASRFIEEVLGQKLSARLKPEFYTSHTQTTVRNNTGAAS